MTAQHASSTLLAELVEGCGDLVACGGQGLAGVVKAVVRSCAEAGFRSVDFVGVALPK